MHAPWYKKKPVYKILQWTYRAVIIYLVSPDNALWSVARNMYFIKSNTKQIISPFMILELKSQEKNYKYNVLFSDTLHTPIGQCKNVNLVSSLPYKICHWPEVVLL